ncbi:MAG: carboxylesterase [Porticoccus sp.]|jgi:phospholipase/carboxylesterase|nr:carboxylesterase [Porticoccus sp.]|tara:strand:+ start:290 stop:949 length:660 start_codon:yes stop_codon:yes gene_type:complete
MDLLEKIEIEPKKKADSTIIWLHGLGANGADFEPIVKELNLPLTNSTRFIFPTAPKIPVTINNKFLMSAWYDILEVVNDRKINEGQLVESAGQIHLLIDEEINRGINSKNIIIAGFSQGGAVALHAALTYPKSLSGILAMSTYFATAEIIKIAPENKNLPIQFFHGKHDVVIPEIQAKISVEKLITLGLNPKYKVFSMDHSVCLEEIADISDWLQDRIK